MQVPESILALSREMNKQDNRSTALPLYIVVGDERRYGDSGWCGERERKEEPDESDLCECCLREYESDDFDGELPENCRDCDTDAFHWYQIEKHVPYLQHGVFLTAEACDEYITRRYYEMPENAVSYAISSYWSYDMTSVLRFISSLTTDDGAASSNYQ